MKTNLRKINARRAARVATGVLLLALTLTTSGCFALAVGAGAGAGVAYVRGDLDAQLTAGLEKSAKAVNKAIEQLKYAKVSENRDALQATLVARNAADKKIEFILVRVNDGATALKIRVGTFGDESLQVEILGRVRANL